MTDSKETISGVDPSGMEHIDGSRPQTNVERVKARINQLKRVGEELAKDLGLPPEAKYEVLSEIDRAQRASSKEATSNVTPSLVKAVVGDPTFEDIKAHIDQTFVQECMDIANTMTQNAKRLARKLGVPESEWSNILAVMYSVKEIKETTKTDKDN